ncbi:MAG: CNNM domain-containing protein [Candidatus Omnitrophota bacterium]
MILLIFLILLAVAAEAFFAGAETAFISVNFLKLMHLIEKKNKKALLVHDILKKPERLLVTTLVGTNLSVVVSSACATALFARFKPSYEALLTTVVMTPISFIFAELLSKTVARYRANRAVLSLAGFLVFFSRLLTPLVAFFTLVARSVAGIINPGGVKKNPFLTKDEIKCLIKDISCEGILEPREKEAIDKIFDMTLTKAADVMVPLREAARFDVSEDMGTLRQKMRTARFTRFPVFEGRELKGMINIYDLFYAVPDDWRSVIRPLVRVEQEESLDKVFSKMQPRKESMAAVFKGPEPVGIVTMEDLMEEVTSRLALPEKKTL